MAPARSASFSTVRLVADDVAGPGAGRGPDKRGSGVAADRVAGERTNAGAQPGPPLGVVAAAAQEDKAAQNTGGRRRPEAS